MKITVLAVNREYLSVKKIIGQYLTQGAQVEIQEYPFDLDVPVVYELKVLEDKGRHKN